MLSTLIISDDKIVHVCLQFGESDVILIEGQIYNHKVNIRISEELKKLGLSEALIANQKYEGEKITVETCRELLRKERNHTQANIILESTNTSNLNSQSVVSNSVNIIQTVKSYESEQTW